MLHIKYDGKIYEYAEGTTYEEIAKDFQSKYAARIALVIANGKIRELLKAPERDTEISFLTYADDAGHKSYVRTATMVLMRAMYDILPEVHPDQIKVEFSIGKGYYISVRGVNLTDAIVAKAETRMRELVEQAEPIHKQAMPKDEAIALFVQMHMDDKVKLFRYRRSSMINVYNMGSYYDYYYGYMLPHAGYVPHFSLQNDQICEGKLNDLILVQEALQERRIGEIAKDIASRDGVKFVMIAGPSSSGKTTFSHRLSIQLRTLGLVPHPIALDDYFKNRSETPRDENGDYNFECLEALDVEQFNKDMSDLLAGKEVELPTFNFKTGAREYRGNVKKLGEEDILVLEGIHGLNDAMSYSLPNSSKYKIYISALTSLNIDEHNRIPTTDGRLIRRMVRDARTRGASAKRTIQMWPSVRKGEEENIFPYQEKADAFFNSVLIYELAVLKQFAEPLLFNITEEEPEYYEAKRLLKFLEYFLGVSTEHLPNNSIVREFVGGSCFPV